ncbi:hypothetical protein [Sphingomonas paeninsulae]|uniref:hypothetical protein n=1 Tax=Sphingomonas paeninsulae TaxID=2319844 RepID=UPI001EF050B5|nr:hypothetical protein [Sphingomonas paeninsulae]
MTVVGFGLPFALAFSAVGFLVAMPRETAVFWTPAAFIIASALAIVGGLAARSNAQLDYGLKAITGVTLLVLPFVRLVSGGPGWPLAAGQPIIIAIDIAMAAAGGWMLWSLRANSPGNVAPAPVLQFAE